MTAENGGVSGPQIRLGVRVLAEVERTVLT